MNVQELINELEKIEDKTMPIIIEHDRYYHEAKYLETKLLYTEDNKINITDYIEEHSVPFNGLIIDVW